MKSLLSVNNIIIAGIALIVLLAGVRLYQLNARNVTWCLTHSYSCDIARLESVKGELEKVNEINLPTAK